jgi:hypothetical protein
MLAPHLGVQPWDFSPHDAPVFSEIKFYGTNARDMAHEFNASYRDRCAPKALQSKHWIQTKFDRSAILLNQIV